MGKPILWLKGSRGLNNKVDPLRVRSDPETGVQDLAIAYNVDHDESGRISRRRGWETTPITSSCHSLWSDGIDCLFVTGNALCVLGPDFTYTSIRNVTVNARMSYARVANKVYYCNGHERGFVLAGVSYSWDLATEVHGPSSPRQWQDPPTGELLCYFRGRMYVIKGRVAWYSEPFGVHLFDPGRNYLAFESDITMFAGVKEGVFVGTETDVTLLRGRRPAEFLYERATTFGVVPGTVTNIDLSRIGDGSMKGIGVMWTSPEGICLGTAEGEVLNLTERRLTYPRARYGAGLYLGDRYVSTLEP